jgi:hypothetical protein
MSSNILNYSIAGERLQGSVGNENFSMHAWSGGRRGTKTPGADEHSYASYNVFRKEQAGVNGGPLPPGLYLCYYATDGPGGQTIRLEPTITAMFQIDAQANVRTYDRSGMYIHGRGPIGSQGCIVVENEADRLRLNKAIKNCPGTVMLRVSDTGMPLPSDRETGTQTA